MDKDGPVDGHQVGCDGERPDRRESDDEMPDNADSRKRAEVGED